VVLDPIRRLVFTARTGTDLRIVLWVSLLIVSVSGPQRAQIRIESGSHQTGSYHCTTQPYTHKQITHIRIHKYLRTHLYIHRLPTSTCTQRYTYTH